MDGKESKNLFWTCIDGRIDGDCPHGSSIPVQLIKFSKEKATGDLFWVLKGTFSPDFKNYLIFQL